MLQNNNYTIFKLKQVHKLISNILYLTKYLVNYNEFYGL